MREAYDVIQWAVVPIDEPTARWVCCLERALALSVAPDTEWRGYCRKLLARRGLFLPRTCSNQSIVDQMIMTITVVTGRKF